MQRVVQMANRAPGTSTGKSRDSMAFGSCVYLRKNTVRIHRLYVSNHCTACNVFAIPPTWMDESNDSILHVANIEGPTA